MSDPFASFTSSDYADIVSGANTSGDFSNLSSNAFDTSSVANAFTGGDLTSALSNAFSSPAFAADASSPQSAAAQAAISPPSQGSPDVQAAAAGGTQSDPQNTQGPQGQGPQKQQTQQNQTASTSAVDQLKKALQQLLKQQAQAKTVNQGSWQPTTAVGPQVTPRGGPAPIAPESGLAALLQQGGATDPSTYGAMPTASQFTGNTLPPSQVPNQGGIANLPGLAPGQTGAQSPGSFYGTSVQPQTAGPVGDPTQGAVPPAPAPTATPTGPADPGRNITVPVPGGPRLGPQTAYEPGAAPQPPTPPDTPPAAQPPQTADGGPSGLRERLYPVPPTQGQPPQGSGVSQMFRDILGTAMSNPMALAELAQLAFGGNRAARILLPMAMGGFRRGRGRGFGGFRGGGGRHGGGFHHGGAGHWAYHHPQRGWQFHDRHPGPPWRGISPAHMHRMLRELGGEQDNQSEIMQALEQMLGNQQDQANQTGNHDPGDPSTGGRNLNNQTGEGYVDSGNPVVNTLTAQESPNGNVVSGSDKDSQGRTAAQGGNRNEISQGYFQIQNYPHSGTWATAAAKAGVDLNKYPTPMHAPFDVQYRVAREIPISAWTTKWALHRKYGSFPDTWTFGQVVDHFSPGGLHMAGQGGDQSAGPAYEPGGAQMAAAQ